MENFTCQKLEQDEAFDCVLQCYPGLSIYNELTLIKLGKIVVIISSNNSSLFLSLVKLCLAFQVKILFSHSFGFYKYIHVLF